MYKLKITKIVKKLFDEDQGDRASIKFKKHTDKKRFQIIGLRDDKRIKKLQQILDKKPILHGIDYFRAGLIFQHGRSLNSIRKARELAKMSFGLGYKRGKWLYAAATDRLLMMQGKKQKFGTQFTKNIETGKWSLHPIQPRTTDAERKKYKVKSLQKIKKMVDILNSKNATTSSLSNIGLTRKR